MARADGEKVVATNRQARHEYQILETVEAGIELRGTEVKSIRAGNVNIKDGYVRIEPPRLEAFLYNVHIQPWEPGSRQNHDPLRPRRLLMHKGEIVELFTRARERGLSLVPLRLHFRGGKAKVDVALVRGKKVWDKRQAIAEREARREMDRAVRHSIR
jgi:SsrA-binding protein